MVMMMIKQWWPWHLPQFFSVPLPVKSSPCLLSCMSQIWGFSSESNLMILAFCFNWQTCMFSSDVVGEDEAITHPRSIGPQPLQSHTHDWKLRHHLKAKVAEAEGPLLGSLPKSNTLECHSVLPSTHTKRKVFYSVWLWYK